MGGRYVGDIETTLIRPDGLTDKIHSAVLIDIDTDEVFDYAFHRPGDREAFIKRYSEADLIVGHNFIGFDHKQIEHHFGVSKERHQVLDTIPLGRLIWSDIKNVGPNGKGDYALNKPWKEWTIERDVAAAKGNTFSKPAPQAFPGNFIGAASLEAWGLRMGTELKADYSKLKKEEGKAKGIEGEQALLEYVWGTWNEDMHSYMIQDGRVNLAVFRMYMSELEGRTDPKTGLPIPWKQSVDLTTRLQWICSKIERNGWPFDSDKAQALYAKLAEERERLRQELCCIFPPKRIQLEDFIPKRNNKTKGYVAGVPVERWKTVEFNPTSRDQISERLIQKYGWQPVEYNEGKKDEYGEIVTPGKPKVSDDILQELWKTRRWPECEKLSRLFMLQKRIGQLAEGPQAWLKKVSPDGRLRGRYNVNGTLGGRASHSNPNKGQVPAVRVPFGFECRELFHVPASWGVQVGVDQSGLELRALGSFLCGFDNGAYIEEVLNGDIHWENAKAIFGFPEDTALDKNNKKHKAARDFSKTIIYALIYGAADPKLGSIIGKGRMAGAQIRKRMMTRFPALARLIEEVSKASKRGWIKGIDNRVLPIRSPHAALNTVLQSAGYVICAQWLIEIEDACEAAGLKEGWDGDYVWLGWIHDEAQFAVRHDKADMFQELVIHAARIAGEPFPQWRCPTDGEAKVGANWAECH